jgi:56kDa selenium binding protein (SBP56)
MALLRPDSTFYSSPKMAMRAPPEILAYVVVLSPNDNGHPDALAVLDVDPVSETSGQVVGRVEMPNAGDELHHFGWNACSAALCPYAPHPHVERRYLIVPGLGEEYQMALVLRPAHDPTKTYGFSGTVVCLEDLSSSIWLWYREDDGKWAIRKVIDIPAEPADPDLLPPMLKDFGVQPLITDLNLSLDDRFLYVSCWGTGELHQYDVSDPFTPRQMGSVHLGGIVRKTAHPSAARSLNGGPQMVEISRDGCRVYFGNSLYSEWDKQFYRSSTPEPEHSSSSERTS